MRRWWRRVRADPVWWLRAKSRRAHRREGIGAYGRDYGDGFAARPSGDFAVRGALREVRL